MKTIKNILIVCFCACGLPIFAQNAVTISGTVTDAQGVPVPQAVVAVENTSRGTLTDDNGRYSFQSAAGKQALVVSAFGYNTVRKPLDITRSAKFDFVLEPVSVSLAEVQVLGQSNGEKIRQKVYSAANLDIRPVAASLSNLNALVSRASGIRIREEGGVGSDFNLSINGLSGSAVRYFIDGVPLSAMGSGVSLANLPVNLVERVEIFKGVVPAELGEDALGGAINIITRREKNNYVDVSLGAGSFRSYKADFNAQYVHRKSGFTVRPSFALNHSKNNYLMRGVEVWNEAAREYRPMDKRRFHDGYKSGLARVEAGFTHRPWADEMMLGITLSAQQKELQTGATQDIVIGNALRDARSWAVSARYRKNGFLNGRANATLYLSYTHNHTVVTDTVFRRYAWDATWQNTSFSELSGRGKSIRHAIRPQLLVRANMGYALHPHHVLSANIMLNSAGNNRYDDFDTQFVPSNDNLDRYTAGISYNQHLFGGRLNNTFFAKEYVFRSRIRQKDLEWLTGAREHPGKINRAYTGYGFGSRYSFGRLFSAKASFEHSVRLPQAYELLGNGETVVANVALNPENSYNLNVGGYGEWRFADGKNKVEYEAGAFLRRVRDYIYRVSLGDRQSQYINDDAVFVRGVEGEVNYIRGNLFRAMLNASYVDERSKSRFYLDGKPKVTYNNRMPNRPWFFANASATWRIEKPFGRSGEYIRTEYACRFTQRFLRTWEQYGSQESKLVIPSQWNHDVYVTWAFADGRYHVSLECTNLFDAVLYDNYMLQKPGRGIFGKFSLFLK